MQVLIEFVFLCHSLVGLAREPSLHRLQQKCSPRSRKGWQDHPTVIEIEPVVVKVELVLPLWVTCKLHHLYYTSFAAWLMSNGIAISRSHYWYAYTVYVHYDFHSNIGSSNKMSLSHLRLWINGGTQGRAWGEAGGAAAPCPRSLGAPSRYTYAMGRCSYMWQRH
jgi:hypothetical protein